MKFQKHSFTLVELIVSMAVFALLSMMVVQLFSATQKLWVSNNQKSEISAEGRLALDLISNLLMSSTANPRYDNVRVGSDYFELLRGGKGPENATSQLYFATKSNQQALVGSSSASPACFVGVQVVQVTGNDDPDKGHYVLVVSTKTSNDNPSFKEHFPNNTQGTTSLTALLDAGTDSSFDNIVSNNSYKVSRIATNVVDFQVRTYPDKTEMMNGTGNVTRGVDDSRPEAVEIELTLMDKEHYKLYLNNDSNRRKLLHDQYGRTFRRIVWLDGMNRTDDLTGEWE